MALVKKQQKKTHRRLPLEMECEIFKFLKLEIQQKFICEMGRGIYRIFGHKLHTKSKKLRNPMGNRWEGHGTKTIKDKMLPDQLADANWLNEYNMAAKISPDGLKVSDNTKRRGLNVYAEQGFDLSRKFRKDRFPGTIVYYFEITQMSSSKWPFYVGLSNGMISDDESIISQANCYAISNRPHQCFLSGKLHNFEWPNGVIKIKHKSNLNGPCDTYGCGLLLSPTNKLAIFFTVNGILMGEQIPVNPSGHRLFPTVCMTKVKLKANFGDNPAKPFKYDIKKCPRLMFE